MFALQEAALKTDAVQFTVCVWVRLHYVRKPNYLWSYCWDDGEGAPSCSSFVFQVSRKQLLCAITSIFAAAQGEGTFEFHVHGLAWPADTRDYNLDQHWNHICTTFRGGSTVQYTITVNGQMIENGTENMSHSGLEKGGVDNFYTYYSGFYIRTFLTAV